MSSVTRAMLWEFWRLSRMELALRIGYSSFIVLFLVFSAGQIGHERVPVELVASVCVVILFVGGVFSSAIVKLEDSEVGFVFSYGFTCPVSSRELVGWRLTFLVVTGNLCYLLPAMLLRLLSGIELPVVPVVCVITSLTLCVASAAWSSSGRLGRIVAVVTVLATFVIIAAVFYWNRRTEVPLLLAVGQPDFLTLGWWQYLSLIVVAVIAVHTCIRSVDAQRHGERVILGWIERDRHRQKPGMKKTVAGASDHALIDREMTLWQAGIWRLWRQSGLLVSQIAVAAPLLIAAVISGVQIANQDWRNGPFCWMAALIVAVPVYQILLAELMQGLSRLPGTARLSVFDAVQPVREDLIVGMRMLMIAGVTIGGLLLMAVIAGLQTTWAGDWIVWQRMGDAVTPHISAAEGGAVAHATLTLIACFFLSSAGMLAFSYCSSLIQERHVAAAMGIAMTLGLVGLFDVKHNWSLDTFWICVQLIWATGAVSASGLVIFFACRHRCFGRTYGLFAIVLSLIVITGLLRLGDVAVARLPVSLSAFQSLLAILSLTTSVPAIALAPVLALYLHRHR